MELTEELRAALASVNHRAVLAVPLRAKGEIVGALSIADSVARTFTVSEIDLL